jgi:hypothetical protein
MNKIQQWAREAELAEPSDTWESLPASYTAALESFATLARADLETELKIAQSTIDNCREQGALVATERDAWRKAHDEQVELLNKIASERDELRVDAAMRGKK